MQRLLRGEAPQQESGRGYPSHSWHLDVDRKTGNRGKTSGSARLDRASAPPIVQEVLRSAGRPLDPASRAFMERRFGHDFSHVQVHTDSQAARSAKAIKARAYTVGKNVVFADNQFSPATTEGKRLLAHELTHVVQQGCGPTAIQRSPDEKDDRDDEAPVPGPRPISLLLLDSAHLCGGQECLTDEELEALPEAGSREEARRMVKARKAEERAQHAVQERYERRSNQDLDKKIVQIREELPTRSEADARTLQKMLQRLEKEQTRRRALPISEPTTVAQAIQMMNEAWSVAEKEHPPDQTRALHLVERVHRWIHRIAAPEKYRQYLGNLPMAVDTAMMTVGATKGYIDWIFSQLRQYALGTGGATIGGHWEQAITALGSNDVRQILEIMGGEKQIEKTQFYAESKALGSRLMTEAYIYAAAVAAPVVIAGGWEAAGALFETGSWTAFQMAPRLVAWAGMHPFLAAEILGSGLTLAEKAAHEGLTPEDWLWTMLTLGYAHGQDLSMGGGPRGGPSGGMEPEPAPAPINPRGGGWMAKFLMSAQLGTVKAAPATGGAGTGGSIGSTRPVPAMVSPAPELAPGPETMSAPFRGAPAATPEGAPPIVPSAPKPIVTEPPATLAPQPAAVVTPPIADTPPVTTQTVVPPIAKAPPAPVPAQVPSVGSIPRTPVRRIVIAPPAQPSPATPLPQVAGEPDYGPMRQRVLTVANRDITVGVHANVTVSGKPALEGIGGAAFSEFDPERAAALGGRAAVLPEVAQPPGTPAKKGSQPSAGLIVEPRAGAQEIEVMAWNTGAPERGANVSHAERQVIEWFRGRDPKWIARVTSVDVVVFGREICPLCAADIRALQAAYPHIKFTWVRGDAG